MEFSFSPIQRERLLDWKKEQDKIYESSAMYAGAIGGRYTYSFTPTGLGLIITVTNNITKDQIDLTNYEDW